MAFSPGGLTWFGGFLFVALLIYFYARKEENKIPDHCRCNIAWIALGLRYRSHRLSSLWRWRLWISNNTSLGNGLFQRDFSPFARVPAFPEITSKFPNGIVPDSTLCQPTPVYEFIMCTILFFILWKNRPDHRHRKNVHVVSRCRGFGAVYDRISAHQPENTHRLVRSAIDLCRSDTLRLVGLRLIPSAKKTSRMKTVTLLSKQIAIFAKLRKTC